jgi:cysteine desulfurase / selenocysteine lyase
VATASTHPPVHPVLKRESDEPQVTTSGAHDPRSGRSHPFGEPLFNGALYSTGAVASPTSATTSIPGIQIAEPPEFYFLGDRKVGDLSGPADKKNRPSAAGLSVFDVEAIRRDFPALNQRVNGHRLIWLDNAATTQKPRSVIDATAQFYRRDNSNIHRSAHELARRATRYSRPGVKK